MRTVLGGDFMSTSTDHLAGLNVPAERRFYPRVTPSVPIYVAFGSNNLGTLLNVSENGLQVVTPNRLDLNSVYRVFLPLDGVPGTITVSVRTIWTANSQNSSGIQLLDLSEQDREQIRKWVALQSSRSENLKGWFLPKGAEAPPEPAEPSPELAELPLQAVEPTRKPEFAPMPLPIHGDFTYEPPPEPKRGFFSFRRGHQEPRVKSRSTMSLPVLWTALMLTVCLALAWSFRQDLEAKFLHRSPQVASQEAPSLDPSPPDAVPHKPAVPTPTEIPPEPRANAGPSDDTGSIPAAPPPAAAKPVSPQVAMPKHLELKVPAVRQNAEALPKPPVEPAVREAPRSYAASAAPIPAPATTKDATSARTPLPETIPAPVISTPAPVAPPPAALTTAPPPARIQPSTNPPAINDSATKAPATDSSSRKSAIAGSIYKSDGAEALAPGKASVTPPTSAPVQASQPSLTPRANSNSPVVSKSDAFSSAVVQMDAPQASVVEVTAPKGFSASFVNLPGERILRSASFTIHIQRAVRIPGEKLPGERWLWKGHLKVAIGELTSRVDPSLPQIPAPYGSITVLATIDKSGYVTNLQPLYGSFAFAQSVARAVRNWHFEPTYLENKPVDTRAKIEIDFHPPSARTSKP
jgi:hypothetical protein